MQRRNFFVIVLLFFLPCFSCPALANFQNLRNFAFFPWTLSDLEQGAWEASSDGDPASGKGFGGGSSSAGDEDEDNRTSDYNSHPSYYEVNAPYIPDYRPTGPY